MAVTLTDFARETLALYGFGFVSSCDSDQRSEMSRGFGYSYDENNGIMTVSILKADSAKLLACLSKTKKMAIVITDPMSFKTIQMKGDYVSHADASPDEINLITNEFGNRRKEVLTMFGVQDNVQANLRPLPAISIKMECKEIFDQTPRLNTGNKIC